MKNIKIIKNCLIINETIFNCIDKNINELDKVDTIIRNPVADKEVTMRYKNLRSISRLFRYLKNLYFSNNYTEEMYTKFVLLVINNTVKSIIDNKYVIPKQLFFILKTRPNSSNDICKFEKAIIFAATYFKFDFIRFLKYEYSAAIDAGFKPKSF